MTNSKKTYPHIFLPDNLGKTYDYSKSGGGKSSKIPNRNDRATHADTLLKEIESAFHEYKQIQEKLELSSDTGIYLSIEGQQGYDLITNGLEAIGKTRIVNERITENKKQIATVYIPPNANAYFADRINAYKDKIIQEREPGKSSHRTYDNLINSIEKIKVAKLESFWFGSSPIPEEKCWYEIWGLHPEKRRQRKKEKTKVNDKRQKI
jgi:hypothetical protein